jgi:aminoglycoside phosphotransferase (APT) family kinase protein
MLTAADAVTYLLEQRILSTADVVQGGVIVEEISRRNQSLSVRTHHGGAWLLKQSDQRQSSKTLHREADIYRLLWTAEPSFARRYLPAVRLFDEQHELLILDYIDDADTLAATQGRDTRFAGARAAELGRVVAHLHALDPPQSSASDAPPPWVLSICRPSREVLTDFSSAALAGIQIVQQSMIVRESIAQLSRPSGQRALVHGDLRLDNCLVRGSGRQIVPAELFLIDWELGGVGDPCWDIGTVFGEYLATWVRSMPVASSLSLSESLALARYPLDTLLRDFAAFWRAYQQGRPSWTAQPEFLVRSVQWTGARLLQSAVEVAQTSAQLARSVVYLLQLAENVLADPRHAARNLLKLPAA